MKADFEHFELKVVGSKIIGGDDKVISVFDAEGFKGSISTIVDKSTLVQYVIDNELNKVYIDEPDNLVTVNAINYLEDNYVNVMKAYVTDKLT